MQSQKYYIDDQGRINAFFKAAPYHGPFKGQDLQNTHFSKRTDFGPLDTALSYLDHNNLAKSHPEVANLPGISDRLGVAKKEMTTDEGLVYRIIVDERYRYKNMVQRLLDEDMLEASATPYQKSYQYDPKTGEILKYEIVEVSLTWKPANPEAENIFKSIILKELEMADETNTNAATQEAAAETASETPVTDAVEAIFQQAENTNEKSVPAFLSEILAGLNDMKAEIAEIKAAQATQEKSIKDFTLAIPKGFEAIQKNLKATVVEDQKRSPLEKSVVDKFQQSTSRSSAPGRDLKATAQN